MITTRAWALAGAATVALGLGAAQLSGAAAASGHTRSTAPAKAPRNPPHIIYSSALADAESFLRTYVRPNGQVIRLNDGDDTVSEGQAYGLLISQVANRPKEFGLIWRWTAAHLQQHDGLLAWHASASGAVLSAEPASDADLLTDWALSRTSGPGSSAYHAQARRMASAILANEVVKHGATLLAAGPWATGTPASLDPSYWAPAIFNSLASFTGNTRFAKLASAATAYTQSLTKGGRLLPPDWAHLQGTTAIANPAPDRSAPTIQYGLDAQRLTVWMATSCLAANRRLAASWWHLLSTPGRAGAQALSPNGTVISSQTNALGYVAAAAAAQAAGDSAAIPHLLAEANQTQRSSPDYYGGAWLALGEALLTTNTLGGCH